MLAHAAEGGALPAPTWLLSYIGIALVVGTAAALRATWPRARRAPVDPQLLPAPPVGAGSVLGLVAYVGILTASIIGSDSTASSFSYWFVVVVWRLMTLN